MPMKTAYYTVDGEILAQETSGKRVDYLPDALGSVVATTDQSRSLLVRSRYKPYGPPLDLLVTVNGRFGWIGTLGYRSVSMASRSLYVRQRHIDDVKATWLSVDESWPSVNAYVYSVNPLIDVDPEGLQVSRRKPNQGHLKPSPGRTPLPEIKLPPLPPPPPQSGKSGTDERLWIVVHCLGRIGGIVAGTLMPTTLGQDMTQRRLALLPGPRNPNPDENHCSASYAEYKRFCGSLKPCTTYNDQTAWDYVKCAEKRLIWLYECDSKKGGGKSPKKGTPSSVCRHASAICWNIEQAHDCVKYVPGNVPGVFPVLTEWFGWCTQMKKLCKGAGTPFPKSSIF